MRTMTWLAGCMLVLVAVAASAVKADEVKVPLDQVPKAVMHAVKDRFPRGKLVEAAKETKGDKTEYEVTLKHGDQAIDVLLTPEGKITAIEKIIPVEDLPKCVAAAVAAKYPNKQPTKAEEIFKISGAKEVLEHYEVVVEVDGKGVEVVVLPNGKLKAELKKEAIKD